MKTNIKAIITGFFISKTTIAVNKRETIYFIISVYDKRLSSFFISLILSLFFYLHLLFPLPFCFNFVVSERNVHSFLPTYLAEFSLLFWTFLSGTFFQVGGGGGARAPIAPPCVRACTYPLTTGWVCFDNITESKLLYVTKLKIKKLSTHRRDYKFCCNASSCNYCNDQSHSISSNDRSLHVCLHILKGEK